MFQLFIVIGAVYCAYRVMSAQQLINTSLWLAAVSALVALQLYLLGAVDVAVIELSVGAGLVTVLFVFAFSIVGEYTMDEQSSILRPIAWVLAGAMMLVLGWFTLPMPTTQGAPGATTFARMLWEQRGLDIIAQVVLIFAGVLGLMGLLTDSKLQEPGTSVARYRQQIALEKESHLEALPDGEAHSPQMEVMEHKEVQA